MHCTLEDLQKHMQMDSSLSAKPSNAWKMPSQVGKILKHFLLIFAQCHILILQMCQTSRLHQFSGKTFPTGWEGSKIERCTKYKKEMVYHILYPAPRLVKIQNKIQGIVLLVSGKKRENTGVDQNKCTKRGEPSYLFLYAFAL